MSINVSSNFRLYAQLPLDSRQAVADTTARDAISSGERYDGLAVYCVSDNITYQLQGGITNSDWVEVYGSDGDLWDRVGTVLTPHTSGDSVTAYDYRTTKAIGTIIGTNDWATNANLSSWTGSVPDQFTVISLGGGGGSTVSQEAVIFNSAPYSAKLYGGTGAPDDILGRSVSGLTPGAGYGFGFYLKRDTGVSTYCDVVIIDALTFGAATQQWIAHPYDVTYSAPSGSFTAGDTISTLTGSGYILAVAPTTLTIRISSGTFQLGQTLTSGLGITATEDADASATTAAWYPIIPANPTTDTKTLTTDAWASEGIVLTVPASGNITVVWVAEVGKNIYLDDVTAATVTVVNGTVFDFITSIDGTTLTSADKIFDFRYTGGAGGSAFKMDGTGAISSDFTYLNFAQDVHITNAGTLTVGANSYLEDVEADLYTNNLTGASTNYVQHFFDVSARTTSLMYHQMGSASTPVTTAGLALSTSIAAMKGDNETVIEGKADSQGLVAPYKISAFRAYAYENASDAAGSLISAYTAYNVPAGGASTVAAYSIDQTSNGFDYGLLSLRGDLNIAAMLEYGGAGAGPSVNITAGAGGGAGDGGSVGLGYNAGTGGGVDGAILLKRVNTTFGRFYTDAKNAVLFESRATDAADTTAFMLWAYNDLATSGAKLFSMGDNLAGTPSEKLFILKEGEFYSGTNATTTNFPSTQAVFSYSNSGYGAWYGKTGIIGEASATATGGGYGVLGLGCATNDNTGNGGFFLATVSNTADVQHAIGLEGYSGALHTGGRNIAIKATALNANDGNNYSFFGAAGTCYNYNKISSGVLTDLADFATSQGAFSKSDTGYSWPAETGVAGEAVASASQYGCGVAGFAKTSSAQGCYGGYFAAGCSATTDTDPARAVQGVVLATRTGVSGTNTAFYADADNGILNYSFYGLHGTLHNEDIATFGSTSNITDFPLAHLFSSTGNTTYTLPGHIGVVGEALAVESGASGVGFGVIGIAKGANSYGAYGGHFIGMVGTTTDGATVTGVYGESNYAHSGGANVGVYGSAMNSDVNNYSFYGANGNIYNLGRILGYQGANVTAANDITLGKGNYFYITGATQINRIASAAWTAGSRFVLCFGQNPVVKNGTAGDATYGRILTDTATDINTTVGCLVDVFYDGTDFKATPLWTAS